MRFLAVRRSVGFGFFAIVIVIRFSSLSPGLAGKRKRCGSRVRCVRDYFQASGAEWNREPQGDFVAFSGWWSLVELIGKVLPAR